MGRGSKKTTNEDIIDAARKLFTESGYNNVSLRDIANELEISVGNLTYYYTSKTELIEAAIISKHNNIKGFESAKSLSELNKLLTTTEDIQKQHLYYFRQYSQLSKISDKIIKLQMDFYLNSERLWEETFSNLSELGIMKKELYESQYCHIISIILFISAHWHERDFLDSTLEIKTPSLKDAIWAMMLPLLTEEGKQIFYSEISNTIT